MVVIQIVAKIVEKGTVTLSTLKTVTFDRFAFCVFMHLWSLRQIDIFRVNKDQGILLCH